MDVKVCCLLCVGRRVIIFLTWYNAFFFTEEVSVVYSEFLNIHIICVGGD